MRRLLASVALLSALACGKTRAFDPPASSSWDDPSADNGFYDATSACRLSCVVDAPRGKHAVRATPEPRVVATLEDALPEVLFIEPACVAVATRPNADDGLVVCVNADDGHVEPKVAFGPPSAMVWTDRLFVADRDANGAARVLFGGDPVAGGEHDVRTLVGHRGEVFWIDGSTAVRRLRHDRSQVDTMTRASRLDARFLAVDDAAFYAARGGALVRLSRAGDAPKVLATAASPIRDVVLSGEWLYWIERGDPRLVCQPDGTSPECGRGQPLLHPTGALRRVRVTAPFDEQLLASDVEDPSGVLVVRSFAYVSMRTGVLRVPLAFREASAGNATVLATATPAIGRPVLDTVGWTLLVATRPPGSGASGIRLVALVP